MKKWTVLVYMAGDNDLDPAGVGDLEEMKRAGSSEFFNVVVQFDRAKGAGKTRRYEITPKKNGRAEARVVEELEETDTGEPKVLEDFIAWGMGNKRYDAEHYMLVLWNHGGGFKDEEIFGRSGLKDREVKQLKESGGYKGGLERVLSIARRGLFIHPTLMDEIVAEKKEWTMGLFKRRYICIDESSMDFLDSQELRKAVRNGIGKGKKKIDIIGFDACLMNMLEVMCQLGECANYVVGSEETEPGYGWPYHTVLGVLHKEPSITPAAFSMKIVSAFGAY